MRNHRIGLVAAAIVICVQWRGGTTWAEPESRAAEELQIRRGLELWLDAGRIDPTPPSSGPHDPAAEKVIDRWSDASGHHRDFTQPTGTSRPTLKKMEETWFVRFDGEDDHLRCLSEPVEFTAATIYLVAAPRANPGEFRGLFAANAAQQRDYESGLTIDLGPGPTRKFDQLNVEGRGFGTARDLISSSDSFGTLRVIEVVIDPRLQEVRLLLNGESQKARPFDPMALSFEQLTLGARFYTNGPAKQQVRGPAAVDVAEVLLYSRTLGPDEAESVRGYLDSKYAKLADALPKHAPSIEHEGIELVKAENPPPVQVLLPGFDVREMPVELPNVNNVRFREDGKLVTLGYGGDIHLLSDTDGDGLEDRSELFWKNEGRLRGPIGAVLTPPGDPRGWGLFVPSKGKVSLIVDTDGDDRADEEVIVASGWKEIPQNVDAVGIAMDTDGNLYFGLGTANFANPYLVDEFGQAAYDTRSDRGTVQKISADFSRRETVCTGIRFPIAFGFNRHGDLFCTEQEGATWLANGNPFDELLHIQPGRHYGFPPRHPRHNPGVIDEPSIFDFSPQHQSTCGMVFNEPISDGALFGPDWWAGDALICGESRGKLWRTQLVKSSAGYVAATQLIACLQMLTVDACVAPNGDLVVACHSGPPDWGTGPTGLGKLFRIRMTDPAAPRPVAIWAESTQEVRICFDHPLDPLSLTNLAAQIRIEYGAHVRAGDRFENLVPPYAVVQQQQMRPRFELPVFGASVTSDLRTMIINTAPMTADVCYSVTLPKFHAPQGDAGPLAQHPQIDLDFQLHGVRAEWRPDEPGSGVVWTGWLPHPDLAVSRRLLDASTAHQSLWEALRQPGKLQLTTQVALHNILRPAIQPGSKIDYEWPAEQAELRFTASQEFPLTTDGRLTIAERASNGQHVVNLVTASETTETASVTITVPTGGDREIDLNCTVSTNEDDRLRPLPLHRFLLPWVRTGESTDVVAAERLPLIAELEGGSWGRGRHVFQSEAAACSKCHALHGNGGRIGPDLGNLVHRDFASVERDILNPSFAINPDYIGHVVTLNDGRVLTGVLQTDEGAVLLGDEKGTVTRLEESDIEHLHPAKVSVMPKGLEEKLSPRQFRDLLTFLLTSPPQMPLDSPLPAPPVRTRAEVATALAGSREMEDSPRPLSIVLVAGQKDHGPGEHDYPAWQRSWAELLTADPTLAVSTAWDFPDDQQLATADVLIFFQKGRFDGQRPEKLDSFLNRGGGAVYIHWAVNGDNRVAEFSKRIGLAARGGRIKFRHGPLTLDIHGTDHPIVRNFDRLQLYDESYWQLTGDAENVTLLATSMEEGEPTPQLWVRDHNPGRVFVSIPGHYSWTFDDPLFRILLLRGIAWTAREPVDRFNDLVPLGARVSR